MRLGGAGKWGFFELAILNFFFFEFFSKKVKNFCFISKKTNCLFKVGIIFFCTMNGFFRILEKGSNNLLQMETKTFTGSVNKALILITTYFFRIKLFFVFQDRNWNFQQLSWNLTKFQLNQTSNTKIRITIFKNKKVWFWKKIQAVVSKYAKIGPKDGTCCPNFQWRFWWKSLRFNASLFYIFCFGWL